MGRLDPLTEYLRSSGEPRILLSWTDFRRLGIDLPHSAKDHRAFWSNSEKNAYSRYWRDAGYRATTAGVNADQVAFVRQTAHPAPSTGRPLVRSHSAPPQPTPERRETPATSDVVLLG